MNILYSDDNNNGNVDFEFEITFGIIELTKILTANKWILQLPQLLVI